MREKESAKEAWKGKGARPVEKEVVWTLDSGGERASSGLWDEVCETSGEWRLASGEVNRGKKHNLLDGDARNSETKERCLLYKTSRPSSRNVSGKLAHI